MAVDNIARALACKALNTENIDTNQAYVGQDITVKFADEIKDYSDEWACQLPLSALSLHCDARLLPYLIFRFSKSNIGTTVNEVKNYFSENVSNTKDGINNRVLNNVGEDIVKAKIKLLYKSRSTFRFNIISRNLPCTSR